LISEKRGGRFRRVFVWRLAFGVMCETTVPASWFETALRASSP
jgi:hypothetical protein